jgi:ankyrin repeat protein
LVALKNNHSKIASLLLTKGCPWDVPDSSDNYPLHYACAFGCIQVIDLLVKAGANYNEYNSWKITPIAAAMLKNHNNLIFKMLEYPNINVNCKDDQGRTLVSNSVRELDLENYKLVEKLVN